MPASDPTRKVALAVAVLLAVVGCRVDRGAVHADGPAGRWVLVSAGDTLEALAARAGVPAEDILEVNGLASAEEIVPGRLLFLLAPSGEASGAGELAVVIARDGGPPLRWPLGVGVVVSSPFGVRGGRPHEGIDLAAPTGTPVFAAADGSVAYAGNGIRGYGNIVVIRHAAAVLTVYAHNSVVLVSRGQPVRAGDRIALVGQSGRATGPHLHFEVRVGEIATNPLPMLPEIPR